MKPWHPAIQDAFDVLTGEKLTIKGYDLYEKEGLKDEENPLLPYNVTEPCIRKKVPDTDIKMEGRLIGGCLDVLTLLLGTKYDKVQAFTERYKEDGIIWFLEACDLNVFAIRRAMWQMEEAGWFQYVKGFLIGRPLCFGQEMMGLDQYQAVLAVAGEKNVPVIMDVDLGHLAPMMPIVTGSCAEVQVQGNDVTLRYDYR